jgi:hypothetical protein
MNINMKLKYEKHIFRVGHIVIYSIGINNKSISEYHIVTDAESFFALVPFFDVSISNISVLLG